MNHSVYNRELLNIYHKSDKNEEMDKVYNMMNVAMVVNRIRPGGLIGIRSEKNANSVLDSMQRLGLFVKDIRLKVTNPPLLLFVREDNQPHRNLLASIITALDSESMPPNNSDKIPLPSDNNQSNSKLGRLLGYFNTMSALHLAENKNAAGIDVIVRHEGVETKIKVFPQKILDITPIKKDILRSMATDIGAMRLPDGFEIVSSRAFYEVDGVKTVIEPLPNRINNANSENEENEENARSIVYNSNNNNIINNMNSIRGQKRPTGGKRRKRQTRSKRSTRRRHTRSSRR